MSLAKLFCECGKEIEIMHSAHGTILWGNCDQCKVFYQALPQMVAVDGAVDKIGQLAHWRTSTGHKA